LTKNERTIKCVRTASGVVELTGVGYRPEGTALVGGREPADRMLIREARIVIGGGSLANDAQLVQRDGEWEIEGDPTEAAFLVAAHKLDGTLDAMGRFARRSEVPFTSERKMMSTVVHGGHDESTFLVAKGAPDVLLGLCTDMQVGNQVVPLNDSDRARALAGVEALSAQAFRTLAVAYRPLDGADTREPGESDEHNLVYVGVVGIIDPPRDEVLAAVAEARGAGVRVVMVTGDYPTTAARIAVDLGIAEPGDKVVTGAELDALSPAQLGEVTAKTSVYARVAPRNKLQIVEGTASRGRGRGGHRRRCQRRTRAEGR
jgi:P-type Ca2+ transporter type 2C